ncbi:unnamed protein product [Rangifer tarandus platyrhynchus]|uniref:Uncharacterized protein n=1 Tax=Rangifer tarandus platyrhynchus TaxID=3082113 RepID=A0AC59ZJZ4_RANTA
MLGNAKVGHHQSHLGVNCLREEFCGQNTSTFPRFLCLKTSLDLPYSLIKYNFVFLVSSLKGSYRAQNSLELKFPSRSSPPFYAKQRTLSFEGKMDIKGLTIPSSQLVQLISKIPCPSRLRDNYFEPPWRRTGPLKTVAFHIHAYIYLLFSWVSAGAH